MLDPEAITEAIKPRLLPHTNGYSELPPIPSRLAGPRRPAKWNGVPWTSGSGHAVSETGLPVPEQDFFILGPLRNLRDPIELNCTAPMYGFLDACSQRAAGRHDHETSG
jgi:hypothetical protein